MDCPPDPSVRTSGRWSTYAIALTVLLALGGHLFSTLVYLSPPNVAKEHFGELADAYMRPLFYQNWHLFSPNPGISSRKLAVRCGAAEEPWGEWFDPLEGLVAEHYENRVSGTGKLLYVYRAVGDDLRLKMKKKMATCQQRLVDAAPDPEWLPEPGEVAEQCSPEALMDELVATDEFALAIRYTQRVCEESVGDPASLDRLQFKLLEFFPVKYAERDQAEATGRRWGKVHEVFFPVIEGE